jgi:hypothetical protein
MEVVKRKNQSHDPLRWRSTPAVRAKSFWFLADSAVVIAGGRAPACGITGTRAINSGHGKKPHQIHWR